MKKIFVVFADGKPYTRHHKPRAHRSTGDLCVTGREHGSSWGVPKPQAGSSSLPGPTP